MAKSSSRAVATKPVKIKTAVVISPEAFRRLGAACLAENLSQSEIVEALINRALSGYVVSVRGPGFHAGQASSPAPIDRQGDGGDVKQESTAA